VQAMLRVRVCGGQCSAGAKNAASAGLGSGGTNMCPMGVANCCQDDRPITTREPAPQAADDAETAARGRPTASSSGAPKTMKKRFTLLPSGSGWMASANKQTTA